jgi:hypothetical protein
MTRTAQCALKMAGERALIGTFNEFIYKSMGLDLKLRCELPFQTFKKTRAMGRHLVRYKLLRRTEPHKT